MTSIPGFEANPGNGLAEILDSERLVTSLVNHDRLHRGGTGDLHQVEGIRRDPNLPLVVIPVDGALVVGEDRLLLVGLLIHMLTDHVGEFLGQNLQGLLHLFLRSGVKFGRLMPREDFSKSSASFMSFFRFFILHLDQFDERAGLQQTDREVGRWNGVLILTLH